MRAVLDTNVVVSALLFGGTPLDIIDLAEASAIELVASPAALDELSRVLTRPRFTKWFSARGLEPSAALTRYAELVTVIQAGDPPRVCRDAADNEIIAAAVAGEADVIVSGDKDLLDCCNQSPVPIVTAVEFLGICRQMLPHS